MKQWVIDNIFNGKSKFMSFLGAVFVVVFLSIVISQMSYWNYYMSRNKITIEVYERMVTGAMKDLFSIIMMIVAFYFRNDDKQTTDQKQLQNEV